MRYSILILGGTGEARRLASRLAGDLRYTVELSLAGRTRTPIEHPVPVRVGGFGGAEGLAQYLQEKKVSILIDATHPYAARISANAAEATKKAGVPMIALRRAPWQRQPDDRWTEVSSIAEAVQLLGEEARRVFLTLGRQELLPFEAAPQHHYLVRSVDPVEPRLAVPNADYLTERGPFEAATEQALLQEHGVEVIVAKNSGGPASYGKIIAARALGIDVILIRRPRLAEVPAVDSVDAVLDHLAHAMPPL